MLRDSVQTAKRCHLELVATPVAYFVTQVTEKEMTEHKDTSKEINNYKRK
jgi:hypothetical protein